MALEFDERGFVINRYPETLQELQNDQIENIETKFKYQNNKVIYQLNSIYSLSIDQLSQLIEFAFDQQKLSSAEGRWLEEIAFTRGVTRIPASSSFTNSQYAVLETGSVIPINSIFESSVTGDRAINTSTVTGSQSNCNEAKVIINDVISNNNYVITINNVDYSYLSNGTPTITEIRDGLQAQFDLDTSKTFTYVLDGDNGFIFTADTDTILNIQVLTTYIIVETVKVYFTLQLIETGDIAVPAGIMDTVRTSVSGLIETNNDTAFTSGRERETDAELRLRIQRGNVGDCTGTVPAIEDAVLTRVNGVASATVIENTEFDPTDGTGRPLGSFETVVVGGDDADVAKVIWETKGAGIQLFGNTTIVHVDSRGRNRFVDFSRPTELVIALRIDYSLYDEEPFPSNGENLMSEISLEYFNSLPVDKDVIPLRVVKDIYNQVSGLGLVTVYAQTLTASGDPVVPGNWSISPIAVSEAQFVSLSEIDITINLI